MKNGDDLAMVLEHTTNSVAWGPTVRHKSPFGSAWILNGLGVDSRSEVDCDCEVNEVAGVTVPLATELLDIEPLDREIGEGLAGVVDLPMLKKLSCGLAGFPDWFV